MKEKLMKKLTAFVLFVAMCFSMLPMDCFAVTTSYTPSDSYKGGKYYQKLLSVQLTGNQADDLVAVALSQVGYHEGVSKNDMDGVSNGGGKYTEYGYMHGDASAQWCAYFVSWCARQARIPTSLIPKSGGAGAAKSSNGTYYDVSSGYIPKKGDLIFYEPSGGVASRKTATGIPKGTSHVNICYKDGTDGKIHMIGGNEEGKVRKSDYALPKEIGNWQNIQGYFHPNYSNNKTTDNSGNTVDNVLSKITVSAGGASDITANNVTLKGSCQKPSAAVKLGKCGVYVGTSSSNMTKRISETVSSSLNNLNSGSGFSMTYNGSTHLGMKLSANTTYYYQFFVTYNGTEVKSEVKSFKTANAYKIVNQKAILIIPKGKSANAYSTVTGNKVIGTYGSADAQRLLIPERYADLVDGTRRFEMVANGTSYWIPYDASFMTLTFLPTRIEAKESHIYMKAEEGAYHVVEFSQYPENSFDKIEDYYSDDPDIAYGAWTSGGELRIYATGVGTTTVYFQSVRTKLVIPIKVTVVDGGPPMFGDITISKDSSGEYAVKTTVNDTNLTRLGVSIWHKDDADMKNAADITWYSVEENSMKLGEFVYVSQGPGKYQVTHWFDRSDLGPHAGEYVVAIYAEDSEGALSRNQIGFTEVSAYDAAAFPFEDVRAGDWFYEGIYYNYLKGIMLGMTKEQFGPYTNLTRAQFAAVLYRIEGSPKYETNKSFNDIQGYEWYGPSVLWAAENGIVSGYQNGNFGPDDLITREQMVSMMYRYVNSLELDTSGKTELGNFKDVSKVSAYAVDAVQWAVGNKLMYGKNDGTMLDPQGNTTRSEAAAIIQRYMN